MNISLGERWEKYVEATVGTGRYDSASDVLREGLRLFEQREAKLRALKEMIDASIAEGGSNTEEDVDEALAIEAERLRREGF